MDQGSASTGTGSADVRRLAVRRGADAEARVAQVLESAGWTVLARNWLAAGAELDLVVARGEALRFVEVKQRSMVHTS